MFKGMIFTLLCFSVLGCDVSPEKSNGTGALESPQEGNKNLFTAVLDGDFTTVKNLVNDGVDLEEYDDEGYTALMRAVQIGNAVIVDTLISGGAKVLQPRKGDRTESALDIVDSKNSQIFKRMFSEKNRVLLELENFINSDESVKALEFTQKNYIGVDENLPGAERPAILLLAASNNIDQAYASHLINSHSLEVFKEASYFDALKELNEKLKSPRFFREVVQVVTASGRASDVSLLLVNDSVNLEWVITQAEHLRKVSIETDLKHLCELIPLLFDGSKNRDRSLKTMAALVKLQEGAQDKNKLFQLSIESLSRLLQNDVVYLEDISKVVGIWKRESLPRSEFTLDSLVAPTIIGLKGKNFEISNLSKAIRDVHEFASDGQVFLENSLKAALSQSFITPQKAVVQALLSKISVLAPGILAYAVRNSSGAMVSAVLDSETTFVSEEQEDALLAAVESGSSADAIYGQLQKLKSAGISSGGRGTQDALFTLYDKDFGDAAKPYKNARLLLQNLPSNPVGRMSNEKVSMLLMKSLEDVRVEAGDLSDISEIISKIDSEPFEYGPRYSREFSHANQNFSLQVSFIWDLILTIRYLHLSEKTELAESQYLLEMTLAKFPNENLSMRNPQRSIQTAEDFFISENLLPLVLLLNVDFTNDNTQGVFNNNSVAWTGSMDSYTSMYTSTLTWGMISSRVHFFEQFTEHRPFWKKIAEILISGGMRLSFASGLDGSLYVDTLRQLGMFAKFPSLLDQVKSLELGEVVEELRCTMDRKTFNDSNEGFYPLAAGSKIIDNPLQDESFEGPNQGKFNLTKLGTFKILKDLKRMSCEGQVLPPSDVQFLKAYIPSQVRKSEINYDQPKMLLPTVMGCNDYKHTLQAGKPYSIRVWGPMGNFVPLSDVDGLETMEDEYTPEADCLIFPHDRDLYNEAKLEFLNEWYACAANVKSDAPLISLFKSLENPLGINTRAKSQRGTDWKIKTCDLKE